jgi:hypothetical protein
MRYPDEAKFGLYGGMWEKLKFQLPDCFKINCCGMRTRDFLEQKNPLNSKHLHLFRTTIFYYDF